MTGQRPRTCAACGRGIAAREVYYRFKLVLEGEQDVLDTPGGGGGDDLAALVRQLEEGPEDVRELEEQVHWERAGVVCTACRSVVVRMLAPSSENSGPH
ncbi:hypothetical protein [Pyxidicoccus xibeiensis]|uniref:hypothetical protein n=1 Tax=Pyxidicoccus xibeiensis TaxID=2906759 RepID=UPI0020A727E7|nr:hypothetical protein [Pyxidicoccus xibeiensis]MCP3143638.1 hypothetical protein [Pyxidicoccus xibeiensis]